MEESSLSSKVEQVEVPELTNLTVSATSDLIEEDSVHIVNEINFQPSKSRDIEKGKFMRSTQI